MRLRHILRQVRARSPFGKRRVLMEMASGERVSLRVPVGRGGPRRIVFALHKTGSVLLNRLIEELAEHAGVPTFNLPEVLFRRGVPFVDLVGGFEDLFADPGVIYGGFRQLPRAGSWIDSATPAKVLLLVRDPRDILVSLYFSMKTSHAIPPRGASREKLLRVREEAKSVSLKDYVRRHAPALRRQFERYREAFLERSGFETRIFRYEDVVFEKEAWVREIAAFLELKVASEALSSIAGRHDRRPAAENPNAHLRRVTPGDHREKLPEELISFLDREFAVAVRPFGYDLTGQGL